MSGNTCVQHALRSNTAGGKVNGLTILSSPIACIAQPIGSQSAQAETSEVLAGLSG